MAQAAFVVDPLGWEKAFRSWTGPVGFYVRRKTIELKAVAQLEAPRPGGPPRNRTGINYATGRLAVAGHITTYSSAGAHQDLEGNVIALPKYAAYLHHGTLPHWIFPKHPGGMLHFFWHRKGKFVTLPYVWHPGTAKNEWLVRAMHKVF